MNEIYLYGNITDKVALRFNRYIRQRVMTSYKKELTIYINSIGGGFEDGLSIIDTIKLLKKRGFEITTVIDGKAYSAAGFIFCFGDKRIVNEHSTLMLHPVFADIGDSSVCEMKHYADFTDITYRELLSELIQTCNLKFTEKELYDKFRYDWWLGSREAMELGFANQHAI
jgi:ATP-dependent protease ClpP protease subunit